MDLQSDTIQEGGEEILRNLPDGTHDLVGLSYGGLCCLHAAAVNPSRISNLFLIRVLTQVGCAPLSVRAQRRLLPFIPAIMFDVLYQRRHPGACEPLNKQRITKRLTSVWCSVPSARVDVPVYWISPVGPTLFGSTVSEDVLL